MNLLRTVGRLLLHPLWLFFALPGYVSWRLLSALPIGPIGVGAGMGALMAFCLFIPFSMRVRTMLDRKLAERISWVGSTAMGFFSSLLVLTLLRDLVLVSTHLFMPVEPAWLTTLSAQLTLVLAFLVPGTGFIIV